MSFLKSVEFAFEEVKLRQNGRDSLLKFGIDYLDDAMIGILKNDLILIGAASGNGKTQTCCNIARANIELGKKVHYIALEAEYLEIERRIKYQLFAKHFFSDPQRPSVFINFQEWMLGDFIESCAYAEAQAASEFLKSYEGLFTYYKVDRFDVSDLIMKVTECSGETDLVIIDHIHYMDFEDDNENRAIKEIAKTSRTLAIEQGKPIILVSHMRKRDRNYNEFAPGLEEFHGSSDLFKIATKAITLGPGIADKDGKMETYFRIVKNRFEGSVTRFIGKGIYSSKEGKYESGYEIGGANQKRDDEFKTLEGDSLPRWVRSNDRERSGARQNAPVTDASAVYGGRKKPVQNVPNYAEGL